ncbi:MAG: cytochrome c maturation protein CcmE [Chitinophagaceae bacterium]|jgi:cytochrome c-type biogenesis protein CcmE|nr:cytochrome c maturation protein CcmE [Chitinophagaceae bacterium]MBK7678315.1 cytochrome c maturation protein CcmE [Chitinophagaceae bacterium]MBK8301479.1 cytochrome c maturation protein CcmE [Chitinophagaceae bacterium]MBK9464622.1 cytochrome c maturation protein CcmE [Chitinophagaceae bacterium]MBK9660023.1 cytochrome c maturation protein CcmE [Chitinophagaceae bacterium]
MKKIHIILLVFIAGAIALLISLLNTGSTYDTIAEAKAKPGKFVHVAVRRDTTMTVEYDQLKDPNYLSFHAVAVDTSKETMKVVYRGGPIENLMISERLILKGKFEGDHFECKEVQSKCPSKYKENMKPQQNNSAGPSAEKTIETSSAINQSPTNSEAK